MKKTLLLLTALASLTIAAHAQLKPTYGSWYYDTVGIFDRLTIKYEWAGEEGDFTYQGVVSQRGEGCVAFSTLGARIQNVLYTGNGFPRDGLFIHENHNLNPAPDRLHFKRY